MDRRAIGAARVHPDGSGKSADWAICSVDHAMPGLSARDGLARWQARALACAVLCTLAGALAAPTATLLIVFALSSAFFLGVVVLRLAAVTTALVSVPRSEPEQERETDLPVYTLLVPLYREASVVPRLLAALEGLDFPGRSSTQSSCWKLTTTKPLEP
jgi:glycosyltransferase XagB